MDPLTASGLVSNVFSFVSFASDLIKGTLEIRASASGRSADIVKLDTVCEQLKCLCDGLRPCTEYQIVKANYQHQEDQVSKVFVAVQSLCQV